jgi:hypothetical protein
MPSPGATFGERARGQHLTLWQTAEAGCRQLVDVAGLALFNSGDLCHLESPLAQFPVDDAEAGLGSAVLVEVDFQAVTERARPRSIGQRLAAQPPCPDVCEPLERNPFEELGGQRLDVCPDLREEPELTRPILRHQSVQENSAGSKPAAVATSSKLSRLPSSSR